MKQMFLSLSFHSLTEEGATVPTVRQVIAEDEEEHGEAQDQSDFKRVAFSSFEWQSKAHQVSQ